MIAKVYGIPNCDSVKQAIRSLKQRQIEVVFHDLRKQGLDVTLLDQWLATLSPEALLNRKSATWRQLDDAQKCSADTPQGLKTLLIEHPTLIKRPVVHFDDALSIGKTDFSEH